MVDYTIWIPPVGTPAAIRVAVGVEAHGLMAAAARLEADAETGLAGVRYETPSWLSWPNSRCTATR